MARSTYIYELRVNGAAVAYFTVKYEALYFARQLPTWELYRHKDGQFIRLDTPRVATQDGND